MSVIHPLFNFRGPGRVRILAIWAAVAGIFAGGVFLALQPNDPAADDHVRLLLLLAWGALGLGFAWMRFRPRKPYDETAARPQVEAFQAKRAWLLLVLALFIAAAVTPMTVYETLFGRDHTSALNRIFDAALLLAPCGLAIGLITTGVYSRQWGKLVDDEMTLAHRAEAFKTGFAFFAALGAAAFVGVLFRPDWAVGALPLVIGLSVAAASVRFALLERAAAVAEA